MKVPWIFGLPHCVRFSSLVFIVDQSIFLRGNWITSLRSVFLKCLKSNKEKSSVCNAFFFYETHLIEASFTSVYCIKKVLPERKDFFLCPRLDSNQHTCWHHPLKMACLPISPRGQQTIRFCNRDTKINILTKCLLRNIRKT